jgi:hypothetical protein
VRLLDRAACSALTPTQRAKYGISVLDYLIYINSSVKPFRQTNKKADGNSGSWQGGKK